MSANIFGDRFYSRDSAAWHKIGTTFSGPMTAADAVRNSGLDYNIHLLPAYVSAGGANIELPGRRVIMREPTADDPMWRQLGTNLVSDQYSFLQNRETAELIEPLAEIWPVETVGALGHGETIFFTLNAGQMDIFGEEIKNYFLVADTRDGGTTKKIVFTPIRVVCQNTLSTGLKAATSTVSFAHQSGIKLAVQHYTELIKQMQGSMAVVESFFNRLATTKVKDEDKLAIFTAAYPDPARSKKLDFLTGANIDETSVLYDEMTDLEQQFAYYGSRAAGFRSAADELFGKFSDEFPQTAGTAWAAYNAVVELEDFRRGSGKVAESAVFGPRAATKKRAFHAAMSLLK